VWHSGMGGCVSYIYRVALWGRRVCILWHSGENGYVSCGIVARAGMYRMA